MWVPETLQATIQSALGESLLVVVSNREPYLHSYDGDTIRCSLAVGGLTAALDPVMSASGGVWIAHGSGDADREVVDADDRVEVPPGESRYALKRVWLSAQEVEGYYTGFSNSALWPLCHVAYMHPVFRKEQWDCYQRVNRLFAQSILQEIEPRSAFVFIQDYHLALVARTIREAGMAPVTAQFWHIPWPSPELFRLCPWQRDILDGLLGNDLLGFHTHHDCKNFLDTVDRGLEAKVDYEDDVVWYKGRPTTVRPFPISVDFGQLSREAQTREVEEEMERLEPALGLEGRLVSLGVDRLDYTKGIPERLAAIDFFLERYQDYRGKVVFVQACALSRSEIDAYGRLGEEVEKQVEQINLRHGSSRWKPIVQLIDASSLTLMALRRLAHVSIVSSLHDGMNLVAKEFVASRFDEDGVLLLSPFTGAAAELTDAVPVNPYAPDQFADAIKTALEMPEEQRRARMRRMRRIVQQNDIYRWAGNILSAMADVRPLP